MAEDTWEKAITRVLEDAEGPLHYREIAERILAQQLYEGVGATPAQTVASILSVSLRNDPNTPFQRVARGEYILREQPADQAETHTEAEAAARDLRVEAGALQAFGMYWRRDAVLWERAKPAIWGVQGRGAQQVDFADQVGVYLLHDRDRVIYVGRATDAQCLRLKAHTTDRLAGRWDRFSWFGLKGVGEDGGLSDAALPWSHTVVIETMEALLIESLEPPLNRKRGDNFAAVEFLQIEDPDITSAQRQKLLREMLDANGNGPRPYTS